MVKMSRCLHEKKKKKKKMEEDKYNLATHLPLRDRSDTEV